MKDTNYLNEMDYVDAIMIIDRHGRIVYSVRYNPRFDNSFCEGDFESIINRNFLEVYPNINPDESTMINCINDGKPIYIKEQVFSDYKGRVINTQNLTIPIIRSGKILGAVELSKDITKIKEQVNKRIYTGPISITSHKNLQRAKFNFEDIITSNKEMIHNIERAKIISNNTSSVIVYGETGTGKELYVQSIHNHSNRRNKPFVVQNCAALPENLFESILFGSVKGAFTGAVDKPGLFEEAHGGTLFLDEINSMPLNLQAKLLRVLQDGRVRRVGDNNEKEVDVRIIAAMNIEPLKAMELGQIREDLFYRLSVVSLKLLPLRERKEDIMIYVDHFIKLYNLRLDKDVIGVSDEVKELFMEYNWPGNVRELQHVIESSINFVSNEEIKLIHLPVYLSDKISKENKIKNQNEDNYDLDCHSSLDDMLEMVEKQMITKALEKTGGNISKASSILQITRQRLHYKLSKYNIEFS
ncbi:sigma 54-interacting transcriptional regulator [Tissierella sp.]|uniref:sigma-54 interaction domain-containing protein n=1 Tax=Tissierella sp. TaxID=41274 RepID=UPI00285F9284|nr:sigma 54-interacting transcriptional regulator [Tissierella sp.]MDR7856990.1 sigma 54-interacting transcriptional regulator [Tissierella sp.]